MSEKKYQIVNDEGVIYYDMLLEKHKEVKMSYSKYISENQEKVINVIDTGDRYVFSFKEKEFELTYSQYQQFRIMLNFLDKYNDIESKFKVIEIFEENEL